MKNEKPPILGSWKNAYLVVFGFLVVQIILFSVFTELYK
jgi:hypothetical protein